MHFDFDAKVAGAVLHGPALEAPEFDAPELTPLTKPLAEATVGLIVTSGAYYPEQMRLGERNDLSYRLLSRHRELTDILFAHKTPIRQFGLADPNVAYPRDTMVDLEQAGVFAHYAENAVSMVGSISRYEELATETAPRIVDEFAGMGVDLVLVVPFCPQCHNAAGVLARALERRGLPTTSLTTLYRHAMAVKPPRATFLDFPSAAPAVALDGPSSSGTSSAPPWKPVPPKASTSHGSCTGCLSSGTKTVRATGSSSSSTSTGWTTRSAAPSAATSAPTARTSAASPATRRSSPSAARVRNSSPAVRRVFRPQRTPWRCSAGRA